MNTNHPAPPAPNDPAPTTATVNPAPNPFRHLVDIDFAAGERDKAEFAARMKESGKRWPRRRAKRRRV
jgi:hypothetical protein